MSSKKHGIIFKIVRTILILMIAVVLLLAGMIGFLSVTEYKPADRETVGGLPGSRQKNLKSEKK